MPLEPAETRPTILVTNRWNRSHLSWIFSKFLTFMLQTFVLTQMCRSPLPMLSRAYFGALKWLQTQINIGEGKITRVSQDLWRGLYIQFFWVESSFSKVQSAKLNADETILMAGTEYFGQTAVQPRYHIPVNTMRKSHNHTLSRHW